MSGLIYVCKLLQAFLSICFIFKVLIHKTPLLYVSCLGNVENSHYCSTSLVEGVSNSPRCHWVVLYMYVYVCMR